MKESKRGNIKENRDKLNQLYEYYQENKSLPTIKENEELAIFFQKLVERKIHFIEEYFQKFRNLKYQIIFDEIIAYVKEHHELPTQDILSSFNTSLLSAYSNYMKGKYPFLNYDDKIRIIKKYCNYTYSVVEDIVEYYKKYNQLPPVGTYNDLNTDIGQYAIDLINDNIPCTDKTKKLLISAGINIISYKQRLKHNDEMIDIIINMKKNNILIAYNNPAIYYFYRDILTGRKRITKEQEIKLKEVGIIPNSEEITFHPNFKNKRRPLSQEEKDELIEESYQYIKRERKIPDENIITKNNISLRKFTRYLIRSKYVLNDEQKEKVSKMREILLEEKEKKKKKNIRHNITEEQKELYINEFVNYVNENHSFPYEKEKIMNFIAKCYSGDIIITREQLKKLETVLPFNGKNYRLIEKEIKINKIIQLLKENNTMNENLKTKEEILSPTLYEFYKELKDNKITISEELKEKLLEIGINITNTHEYKVVKSVFAKNKILLYDLKAKEKQLIILKQKLEKLLEYEEKEKEKILRRK